MKLFVLSLSALLLAAPAFAYEQDNQSMGSASTSTKFSDPDEATPLSSMHVYMNGSNTQNSGNADQSSAHYDYDPQNGTFVPSTAKQ